MDEHGVEIATRNVERRKQGIAEQHDFEWLRKDGNRINVTMETAPIIDEDGNYSGAIAGVIDITERMRAEEKIKAALIEKEVLLKEVHHRVKNNLAVVSSLLSLQARNIEDDNIRKIFDESRSRIRSMALVHEDLYQSADLARVNFADYIRALARQLFIIYNIDPDRIQLQIDVENVTLGIDMAVPCGLLINELLTNSIKYAFPGDRSGEVHVGLYSENDKHVLSVSDNGVGLPQDLDWQETETLGLQLIKALSGQIRGDVELDCSAGTAFRITFPGE